MKGYRCSACGKVFAKQESMLTHARAKHPGFKEPLISPQTRKRIKRYGAMLLIIIAVAGLVYWRSLPPKDAPIVSISPTVYNFGVVSQANGVVTGMATIRNDGDAPLIIDNMETSCSCTSASVVYDGTEGPSFGMAMHGNPQGWSQVIPPGGEAQLKISYDPNVHKTLRGAVTRTITVYSNDPRHKQVTITTRLTQVA